VGEVDPVEVDGGEWRQGLTSDLATPSLLDEARALFISNAQDLPAEAASELQRYCAEPPTDATLVLAYVVGARANGPPKKITQPRRDAPQVRRVGVDRKELPGWVRQSAAAIGLKATAAGASALVQTVGEDPAELDRALEQLAGSHAEEGLSPASVAAQFRGFGDRRIWELTDAAFGGDVTGALRVLAALRAAGDEPLAILGGLASRLRDLIRIRSLPPRTPTAQMAKAAGLRYDWQARRYADQARRFDDGVLEAIHTEVVMADRLLKQGGTGDVVLPSVITRIAGDGASRRVRSG
jgi:DNA polymerase-3 subunit delta